MDIDLNMLVDRMGKLHPELYIFNPENNFVDAAVLFDKNQKIFEPNFLYVAKMSAFSGISFNHAPANLLCIADTPVPPEYLSPSGRMNIILIRKNADIVQVFKEVREFFSMKKRLADGTMKLMDALISGKNIQHILDIGYEILGNPLLFHDTSFKLLGSTKNVNVDDSWWNELAGKNYITYSSIMLLKESGELDRLYKSRVSAFIADVEFSQHRWLEGRVQSEGKQLGLISVIEYHRKFTEGDKELVKTLCGVISVIMQQNAFFYYNKGKMYESFIVDLLEGKEQTQEVIMERQKYMDLNLKENLFILVVSPNRESAGYEPHLYMLELLDNLIHESKSIIYKNHYVVLISRGKKKPFDRESLQPFLEFLRKQKMFAGLSRCFHHISDIQEYYIQSVNSIKLGIRMKNPNTLFQYEDYFVYQLLNIVQEHSDLKSFCSPSLLELMDYDYKNNTSFTQSLSVYLLSGRNIMESARILNIHRNSMDYRINKVEEIINASLSDPEVIFNLYLSLKITNLLENSDSGFS